MAGLGPAVGVLAGGLLSGGPGWRWVFFVNLAVCALIVVGARRLLAPDVRQSASMTDFDTPGAALVTGGMLLLVYALVRGAIERLGIPAMKMSDGPNGVRGEFTADLRTPSVVVPVGIVRGATWDPELIGRVGDLLGREARRKSAHVLLAPAVNLHRTPIGGRTFEYFSEDPSSLLHSGSPPYERFKRTASPSR